MATLLAVQVLSHLIPHTSTHKLSFHKICLVTEVSEKNPLLHTTCAQGTQLHGSK